MPRVSGKVVAKALERGGYILVGTEGSHHQYHKPGIAAIVSVPVHGNQTLPKGTMNSILKQAGLSVADFNALRRNKTAQDVIAKHEAQIREAGHDQSRSTTEHDTRPRDG